MEAYFDNSATTVCLTEVKDIMVKVMVEDYGNPSAMHMKGVEAEKYVNNSKEAIAKSNPIVDDWQQELDYQKEDIQNSDGFRAFQSFNDSEDEDYSNDNKNDSDKPEKANKKSSD